jgi:methanogenic corrinoid protein MtbC1
MSPLKKNAEKKPVHLIAYEWLSANTQSIAEAITARTFALHPELEKRYGERGRAKCEQDAIYHLHYLAEAIANNSEKMFVDYIGWAKIMLRSRGIDPADLGDNLKVMVHVLQLKSPAKYKRFFAQWIDAALTQLPAMPEALPGFIGPGNPFAGLANAYLQRLLLLNREDAIALVTTELESGLSIRDLFHHVIYPVQREVGRLWQENRINVLQEHYCTAATDLLITRLKHNFHAVPRSVHALALCPDGEEHSLGIKMFSELLESDGWKVAYIGPKCPLADVLSHIKNHDTDLVAISIATPLNLARARELIAGIRSFSLNHAPAILVGGAALNSNPEIGRYLQADGVAADVSEGVEIANRLVAQKKLGNPGYVMT